MKKFKEKLHKINWEKFFDRFQHVLFAFAMIGIALPLALHFGKWKTEDMMRLVAIVWIFNAWTWWTQLNKKRKEFTELLMESFEIKKQLMEQSMANKILVEVLNKIDKRVLAQHGISIKVEKPGRTVN